MLLLKAKNTCLSLPPECSVAFDLAFQSCLPILPSFDLQ